LQAALDRPALGAGNRLGRLSATARLWGRAVMLALERVLGLLQLAAAWCAPPLVQRVLVLYLLAEALVLLPLVLRLSWCLTCHHHLI
jgi:hypothetical protein